MTAFTLRRHHPFRNRGTNIIALKASGGAHPSTGFQARDINTGRNGIAVIIPSIPDHGVLTGGTITRDEFTDFLAGYTVNRERYFPC